MRLQAAHVYYKAAHNHHMLHGFAVREAAELHSVAPRSSESHFDNAWRIAMLTAILYTS